MAGRKKRLSNLAWFVRKTPWIVWSGFAVFGIFIFGAMIGLAVADTEKPQETRDLEKESGYRELIDGYQEVSRLIYLQQQDMDVITDSSIWQNYPEELSDAIYSYRQKKDEIIFQWGRIYELRKSAGLTEDEFLKSD